MDRERGKHGPGGGVVRTTTERPGHRRDARHRPPGEALGDRAPGRERHLGVVRRVARRVRLAGISRATRRVRPSVQRPTRDGGQRDDRVGGGRGPPEAGRRRRPLRGRRAELRDRLGDPCALPGGARVRRRGLDGGAAGSVAEGRRARRGAVPTQLRRRDRRAGRLPRDVRARSHAPRRLARGRARPGGRRRAALGHESARRRRGRRGDPRRRRALGAGGAREDSGDRLRGRIDASELARILAADP